MPDAPLTAEVLVCLPGKIDIPLLPTMLLLLYVSDVLWGPIDARLMSVVSLYPGDARRGYRLAPGRGVQ